MESSALESSIGASRMPEDNLPRKRTLDLVDIHDVIALLIRLPAHAQRSSYESHVADHALAGHDS